MTFVDASSWTSYTRARERVFRLNSDSRNTKLPRIQLYKCRRTHLHPHPHIYIYIYRRSGRDWDSDLARTSSYRVLSIDTVSCFHRSIWTWRSRSFPQRYKNDHYDHYDHVLVSTISSSKSVCVHICRQYGLGHLYYHEHTIVNDRVDIVVDILMRIIRCLKALPHLGRDETWISIYGYTDR